jgi:TRAP-type C4-dicarboxylate transport system permease small subunit
MRRLRLALDQVLSTILIWMLIVLLAVMTAQIVLRYGFSTSLIWAEEACRYLLIWVSFLAAMLAYERGEIASVPMLRDALPRRWGLVLAILANLAGIVLLAVLIRTGLDYGVPVPRMFWVYVALPVGLTLFALRLAADIVLYARMIGSGGHARDLRDAGEPEAQA